LACRGRGSVSGDRLELQIGELTAVAGWRGEAKECVVDAEALDGGDGCWTTR
jgi:hypothetical protein